MFIDEHSYMATDSVHPAPRAATGNLSALMRILIVDDEAATLFAYKKLIEREGIGVDVCESLDDAIVQINAYPYSAVIADMRLAGTDNSDGLEILRFVREKRVETKVIIVTGYGNKEIEQTALAMGAAYYFEKPVLPSAILEVLSSLCSAADDT